MADVAPQIEVTGFSVDRDSTCRYDTMVTLEGRGVWTFSVRWSQMETLVKDLHATFTEMPEDLELPRYYFKTTDSAKLDARRRQLEEFWAGTVHWMNEYNETGARYLMDTDAVQRLLRDVDHDFSEAVAPPGIAAPEPEPQYQSRSRPTTPRAAPAVGRAPPERYFDEHHRLGPDDFEALRTLGKGSFGKVLLVRKRDGQDRGKLFAMKILQKRKVVARDQVEHTKAERSVLARMKHIPFIVNVHYAFQTDESLFLVLDFVQGGELFFHLKEHGRFAETAVCFYSAQMLLALEQIHDRGVVYRDLKPENLLLDSDGYIRLTDFGLSKEHVSQTHSGASTFCGTAEYIAPELLSKHSGGGRRKDKKVPHGTAVDMWSLGILMYEMIHGLPPFYDTNTRRMYDKILRAELSFTSSFSDDACDIISRLLERDPRRRMTVTEAKAHRWVQHAGPTSTAVASARALTLRCTVTTSDRFFNVVDWERMLRHDYKPPMVPALDHDLDLSFFDRTFTKEPPYVPCTHLDLFWPQCCTHSQL